tara:strand:+ start:2261 stop:3571 length:1311 start_codon:yes stop_codon:yes gene_type:complete
MESINFLINEHSRKIIDALKKKAGLKEDQEVLKYLLDDVESKVFDEASKIPQDSTKRESNERINPAQIQGLIRSAGEQDITTDGRASFGRSSPGTYSKMQLSPNATKLEPVSHEDHSIQNMGMLEMMHNKIFPVIYIVNDFAANFQDKEYVNLETYRFGLAERASKIAENLERSPYKSLGNGLPQSEGWYLTRSKDSSSKSRKKRFRAGGKQQTANLMAQESRESFISKFLVDEKKGKIGGACVEWGLVEVWNDEFYDVNQGEMVTAPFIRLTKLGNQLARFENEVIRKIREFLMEENDAISITVNSDVIFTDKEVEFLVKEIFSRYPLEYKAMSQMIKRKSFGNGEKSGAIEIMDLFWELQQDHLQEVAAKEFGEIMAKPEDENIFLKFNKRMIKNRALSVMSRLREMDLFEKDGKTIYKISKRGQNLSTLFHAQ